MAIALSVYQLKPRFQQSLRPVMRWLSAAGATPNGVTVAALAGSTVVGGVMALGPARPWGLALLPAWLLVRMALNAIDGMMARECHQASALGLVLNEVGDLVSDVAIFLPLALVAPSAAWPIVLFTIAALVSEFCAVLGIVLGRGRQNQGPMGKSDRALLAGLAALCAGVWPASVSAWSALFSVAAAGAALTGLRRLRAVLR